MALISFFTTLFVLSLRIILHPTAFIVNMTEDEPHPLARMVTINKPAFWIFIGVCIVLYICNKGITPDTGDRSPYALNDVLIIGAAFIGLLLNLSTGAIKVQKLSRVANVICSVFEIGSVAFIIVKMIYK